MKKDHSTALQRRIETHTRVSDCNVSNRQKEARAQATRTKLPWPVEMLPPRSLRPAQRNARTHSKKQIRQLADSMDRFGVINPIIVDDRGRIVAGHTRAEAANLLCLK